MSASWRSIVVRSVVLVCGLAFALPTQARTAEDELPPETKALITKLKDEMKSKTVKIRVSAYTAMGELGEKAKSERRTLCMGMLDGNPLVQTAAADALKKSR